VTVVIDASALICVLLNEPGSETVVPVLRGSLLSAVNLSEAVAKLTDRGLSFDLVTSDIARSEIQIVPFDEKHALLAAQLRPSTRALQLSFADRACLALGSISRRLVWTADKDWSKLVLDPGHGIEIRQIR
jgi:ribonuclease VapC